MATVQGMSGVDLVAVTAELRRMLPLWIHKVYQREDRVCVIRLNNKDREKSTLLIDPGRRFHLLAQMPPMPQIPPAFAMFLRKYLTGGRVDDVRQQGLTRTVVMDIRKSDQVYHLIIEVFDDGNIILCGEDYTIIQPLTRQRFKDRDIFPGQPYIFPPADISLITPAAFDEQLKQDDRDIIRALAIGSYLGGMYAEYICRETGTQKDTLAASADAEAIHAAVHRLLDRVVSTPEPVITKTGCHPLDLGGEVLSRYDRMNDALAAYFPDTVEKEKKAEKQKISREDRIRHQQAEAIKKFEKTIEKNELLAATLYEQYQEVTGVIDTLAKASATRSWQEIEEIIRKDTSGAGTKILKIYPEDAAVDLDLGVVARIYVNESIDQNAGRYYDQVKRFRRKLAGAKAAMEREVARTVKKKTGYARPKKRWFDRFRWFYTSDNVLVIGGRDAGQNEELVKKYLEGKDTFVHADVHGASVVIVKGETAHLDEVAVFAVVYSGAWRAGHGAADVYAARADQVSKTAESGEYLSRGSFVVRGERTWYRDVLLEVAVGLQKRPEARIIGGPVSAVRPRSDQVITLRPGTFEPNDAAKKVVRILRDRLPPEDQKALKFALNTEAVAFFIPPGGSEILEQE